MRKLVLLVLALLLLFASAYAYDLNTSLDDNSFQAIGETIIRGAFGADTVFFAIVFLLLFTIFMWESRVPAGAAIGLGLIVFFALGPLFGGDLSVTLMNLAVLAIGVMIGLAILHFVRR